MTPTPWQCPTCGREFRQRTREHSCQIGTLDDHLVKLPIAIQQTVHAIRAILDGCGPCQFLPLKTMITLRGVRNFGGITLTRARVDLGFFLHRPIVSRRMHRVERYGTKFAHHIHLTSPAEVDADVADWLRESYALGIE
jgi:hypothetical protein